MKKGIIGLFLLCTMAAPSWAQQLQFGGAVYNRDMPMSTDFASLSQTHIFGTARVMGMGGAFTSLGADLSSMSINPAGLGMYQHNELSITPLVPIAHGSTEGTQAWQSNNRTRFALANIGLALNVYESPARSLTSVTIGLGMNRIADFNTRYSYSSESRYDPASGNLMPTLADVFGQQLGQSGIFPADDGSLGYDGYNPFAWPAILGYNGYMISDVGDGNGNHMWSPDCIGHNASVLHSMDVASRGAINEFDLSMGMNFNNIVYFGATIGIQSVHREVGATYQEEYGYFDNDGKMATDAAGNPLETQLDYMNLYQQSVLDGSGLNLKLGVIVRPVAGLRLGVAFHTPTYYWLDYSYRGNIESELYNNNTGDYQQNYDETPTQYDRGADGNSWNFASPTRLMFGASYTFGETAILSFDYERDWYNGIRVKNVPDGADFGPGDYKSEFKQNYQATNSFRAGLEVKPIPILALRVGGGYTGSMFKDKAQYINSPVSYENYYISAGVGVRLSRSTSLDVAYQYVVDKQTPYQLFVSQWNNNSNVPSRLDFLDKNSGEMMTYSGFYNTKMTRHYASLTFSWRF